MGVSHQKLCPAFMALMIPIWLASCADQSRADTEGGEEAGEHAAVESRGEHALSVEPGERGEHSKGGEVHGGGEHAAGGEHGEEGGHDEGGEESGVYIGAGETWDVARRGARLVLSFDSESDAFLGTVENTTEETLCAIRVEVHLSTGTELGPTARVDLPAGQTTSVTLPTEGEAFETFTAHPEMSPCGSNYRRP